MSIRALLLAITLLLGPEAEGPAPLTASVRREGNAVFFKASGKARYEEGAVVFVGLKLEGEEEFVNWHRVDLAHGSYAIEIGPFTEKVLAGNYLLEAWFILDKQPGHIREAFQKERQVPIDHQELIGRGECEVGDRRGWLKDEEEIIAKLLDFLEKIRATQQELDKEVDRHIEANPRPDQASFLSSIGSRKRYLKGLRREVRGWEKGYLYLRHGKWLYTAEDASFTLSDLVDAYLNRFDAGIPSGDDPKGREALRLSLTCERQVDEMKSQLTTQLKAVKAEAARLDTPKK